MTGANSPLGIALLREIGPQHAIGTTLTGRPLLEGFEQVVFSADIVPRQETLSRCYAVINSINTVSNDPTILNDTNVHMAQRIALAAKAAAVPKFVQVSSFSIFGDAELVQEKTSEQPLTAYGRSKAAADSALLAFSDLQFAVETVRLPFMFSATLPGMLAPLVSMCAKLKMMPTVKGAPLRRSMITHADAARQLSRCARSEKSGKSFAADPRPFDFNLLLSLVREELGVNARTIALPKLATDILIKFWPELGRRLFCSSLLSPTANSASNEPTRLELELRELLQINFRM